MRHERGLGLRFLSQAMIRVGDHERNSGGGAQLGENPQQYDRVQAARDRHDQRTALRPKPVAAQGGVREFDERMQRAKVRAADFPGEVGNPGRAKTGSLRAMAVRLESAARPAVVFPRLSGNEVAAWLAFSVSLRSLGHRTGLRVAISNGDSQSRAGGNAAGIRRLPSVRERAELQLNRSDQAMTNTVEVNVVITNRQRDRKVDSRRVRAVAEAALAEAGQGAELGIHFVSAKRSAEVNWQFLQHEGPTDIITFDHGGTPERLFGEMFICVPEAVRQAAEFGTTWEAELLRYVIHGILHLRGYDDLDPVKRRVMKREENRLVRKLARS